jgi:hypothetical protein
LLLAPGNPLRSRLAAKVARDLADRRWQLLLRSRSGVAFVSHATDSENRPVDM